MSTLLLYDPEHEVACLVSEDAGRAFGPAVNGHEGVTLLRAFLDGCPYSPDAMEASQLWTEWQTFLEVVNEQARPPGGEPAPDDEELPNANPPLPGEGEPAVPAGPGEAPPHDAPEPEPAPESAPEVPGEGDPPPHPQGAEQAAAILGHPAQPGDTGHEHVATAIGPDVPAPTLQPGRMPCPACDATGAIGGMDCPACQGAGDLPALVPVA